MSLVSWHKSAIIIFRVLSLTAGVYEIFSNSFVIGFYILLALAAISLPAVFTKNVITRLPFEFEFLFFMMVMLQLIIGETLHFYDYVPYYDKFVHFSLPLFIGIMGFLTAYALTQTGNLKMRTVPLVILITLFTLGLSSIWEIIEFSYDTYVFPLYEGFGQLQGSLTENPLRDTMHDLIADLIGGIFGALIGLRYISAENAKTNSRLSQIVKDIAFNYKKRKVTREAKSQIQENPHQH